MPLMGSPFERNGVDQLEIEYADGDGSESEKATAVLPRLCFRSKYTGVVSISGG